MEEDTIQLGYLEWCETEEPFFAKGGKQFDAAIKIAKNIVSCDAALLKLLGVKCSVFNDSVILRKGIFLKKMGYSLRSQPLILKGLIQTQLLS